ncbi:MAG: SPFH domain-containing protein, partial [Candidatus Omnitrophica bacterium]|nr:SPFH domain-containing protein [Candidatus Omnitrophota bacterium]
MNIVYLLIIAAVVLFFAGIRIVRPTHRGLIERLGKYSRFANPGCHWIRPVIEIIYQVNITEQMIDAE